MFNLKRKFLFGLSVSLVLAMAVGSFALEEGQTPASPRAAEAQSLVGATAGAFTVSGGTQGTDFDYTSPVLTIHSGNLTISTSAETNERIVVDGAATITLEGVNINTSTGSALQIQDDAAFNVNILLADGSTNILKATADNYAGLQKNGPNASTGTLTIGVPSGSAGTGKLEATGGICAAGIGGGIQGSGSNITISGGEVTATGGADGAGIGGGQSGIGSNITINGGVVTATGGSGSAGIGGGYAGSGSDITITGGVVTATGGINGEAGIGGGYHGNGSDITINGGEVTATGGTYGAGIGGGSGGSGSDFTITGGEVTVNGGDYAAGIGGGYYGNGSNITINGGEVTAFGGMAAAGIGGGSGRSGSNNSLNGDAVVLATSGGTAELALEGFVDGQGGSLLTQGIAFTGLGTAFDSDGHATDITWDSNGTMYGDSVAISQNAEFPADLTIDDDKEITLEAGKTLTISAGATLTNEGTINIGEGGNITCQHDEATGTTGEVTTKTDFYLEGSTDVYTTGYQTYQTSAGVQKYTNLPNPDNSNGTVFDSWFTKPGGPGGGGTKVDGTIDVLLNDHSFYEHRVVAEYTITVAEFENGSITPDVTEAVEGVEVTLTVTPDEGYQLKEGSLIVTDADGNEVPVTEEDGKYTFTMPGAEVEISAEFELIPEPEPIPDPSVDPDQGGDGSSKTGDSFAGIAALAILGVATTGAVMLRKRK